MFHLKTSMALLELYCQRCSAALRISSHFFVLLHSFGQLLGPVRHSVHFVLRSAPFHPFVARHFASGDGIQPHPSIAIPGGMHMSFAKPSLQYSLIRTVSRQSLPRWVKSCCQTTKYPWRKGNEIYKFSIGLIYAKWSVSQRTYYHWSWQKRFGDKRSGVFCDSFIWKANKWTDTFYKPFKVWCNNIRQAGKANFSERLIEAKTWGR